MSISPSALQRVPPGAIGHNRGVVRPNYAVIPPEGVLKSRLPDWECTSVYFLAAPALGANFAQMILALNPGGGTTAVITSDVQHFFYVLSGSTILGLEGAQHTLDAGDYAYIPPGNPFTLRSASMESTRVLSSTLAN